MSTSPASASARPEAGAAPVVALVGRPNVGKSALFNRMVGRRQALVEELPGTTRDRLYGDVIHRDERLRLVDTGGLDLDSAREFSTVIRRQVEHAVEEAAVLLFVVDTKDGVLSADEEIAEILRRAGKPVFLLANKVDNDARRDEIMQFYELSLGEPHAVSAQHGLGIIDVLDKVIEVLPPSPVDEAVQSSRLAIVGRPNVGKSMLMNAILGEERVIVSEIPGTTRDAIDTEFQFDGRPVSLVDTAGLRRPGKVGAGLEHHASLRARHAIDRAHTALVVFDASEGLTAQDVHIVGFAIKARAGVVVVANKWDLLAGVDPAEFERDVRRKLRFAPWASFRIASALERQGIAPLMTEALRVCDERHRRVDTGPLNAAIHRAVAEQEPPIVKNRRLKVLYASQPGVAPPTFVIFVNDAKLVHFSYRRYLENVIRRRFGFDGVALRLSFRSRRER